MFYWNENQFSEWDSELRKFYPVGASIEVGSSYYWGSTDIMELNETFDSVFSSNGIYHLMTHPNILEWDQDFTWDHLNYISNRNNVWYVGFGHLYLYRFLANSNQEINLAHEHQSSHPLIFRINQNYPNPFNSNTNIQFNLYDEAHVKINIYDMVGGFTKNLVDELQTSGNKLVKWDATNDLNKPVSAGVYIYNIEVNDLRRSKKMILLK